MMSEAFIIFVNSAPQTMCVFIFVAPHISASIGKTIANKLLYKYKCGVISHCSIGQNFSIFGHVKQSSLVSGFILLHMTNFAQEILSVSSATNMMYWSVRS